MPRKKPKGDGRRSSAETEPRFKEIPPMRLYAHDPEVLPAMRELLSRVPSLNGLDARDIVDELCAQGYMSYRPNEAAVEAALEALEVEGEVLA